MARAVATWEPLSLVRSHYRQRLRARRGFAPRGELRRGLHLNTSRFARPRSDAGHRPSAFGGEKAALAKIYLLLSIKGHSGKPYAKAPTRVNKCYVYIIL